MAKKTPAPPKGARALRQELTRASLELSLAETQYTAQLLQQLTVQEQQFAKSDADEGRWQLVGRDVEAKTLTELRPLDTMRREAYRMWRLSPHARGLLRNFVRFIIGREFSLDFEDQQRGRWNEDKTALQKTTSVDDPLLVRLVWEDFAPRNRFIQRAKEIVLRTFRDGEVFVRRFERSGRVLIRFIEPESVQSPDLDGQVQDTDLAPAAGEAAAPLLDRELIGQKTKIKDGIEYLADDVETVVAYHVKPSSAAPPERVPARDVIHAKAFADSNDLRGIPLLEVVARAITNYEQWEHYRLVLNKVRTAVALIRKVEGTATQAQSIIAGRAAARTAPSGLEPQTPSGRREAMFSAGTVLTPGPGVTYEFASPNLDAKDAGEDGRRFLLSVASGVGLPEMLVTGDWSNSNYASSVESRTPAVREWEDWQDFFEPVFLQIFRWVIEAAVAVLKLPAETNRAAKIQWPALIAKDAAKETERHERLWGAGLLSKTTWAGREDLVYDDELENLRAEAEEGGLGPAAPAPGEGEGEGEEEEAAAIAALTDLERQAEALPAPVRAALTRYLRAASALVEGRAPRRG